jgi:hypothetical protein
MMTSNHQKVEERELDVTLVTALPRDTCYVVVQFIEFGGDHLDLLMGVEKVGLVPTHAHTPTHTRTPTRPHARTPVRACAHSLFLSRC